MCAAGRMRMRLRMRMTRIALGVALPVSPRHETREWYQGMVGVCRDSEEASPADDLSAETRLRNVDELMWMFLRLLTMQESLDKFLAVERSEQPVAEMIADAEQEV